jgi:hypothetical protein
VDQGERKCIGDALNVGCARVLPRDEDHEADRPYPCVPPRADRAARDPLGSSADGSGSSGRVKYFERSSSSTVTKGRLT